MDAAEKLCYLQAGLLSLPFVGMPSKASQNSAAHVPDSKTKVRRRNHSSPVVASLHRRPTPMRVEFKILLPTNKAVLVWHRHVSLTSWNQISPGGRHVPHILVLFEVSACSREDLCLWNLLTFDMLLISAVVGVFRTQNVTWLFTSSKTRAISPQRESFSLSKISSQILKINTDKTRQ